MARPGALMHLALALLAGAGLVQGQAFLEGQLPLKPLITTPVDLLSNNIVTVSGRQAITVVFSRPVIALGSDFGKPQNDGGKLPFTITCAGSPVPAGKSRWVTTTIFRFDTDIDWPTDLDCTLTFAPLTAYDGAVLQLGDLASPRKLRTDGLTVWGTSVESETAEKLTDNSWDANVGMATDKLPEVPPDGIVRINFNTPVNRALVASALALVPNPDNLKLNVSRCFSNAPWLPLPADTTVATADEACISVTFSGPLRDETEHKLVLKAGTKYSEVAGPLKTQVETSVAGLRAFRIPLEDTSDGDKSYRRLRFWLPHGLKSNDASALVGQMSLCQIQGSGCTPVPITSSKLVNKGTLQIQVDGLQPEQSYRISVAANSNVRDGFDKPLQASQRDFKMFTKSTYFSDATPTGYMVFEPAIMPTSWPLIAQGSGADRTTKAGVWSLDIQNEANIQQLVKVLNTLVLVDKELGKPTNEVQAGNPIKASLLNLPLDSSKNVHVVAKCCRRINFDSPSDLASDEVQLLLKTRITANWITKDYKEAVVWVADTTTNAPISGANAYLYSVSFNVGAANPSPPTLLGTCVTNSNGLCSIPAFSSDFMPVVGVVQAPNKDLFYSRGINALSPPLPSPYRASLVLDRQLVKPGDTLHITGYLAQRSKAGSAYTVTAPSISTAAISITPGLDNPDQPTWFKVDVSPEFGSFHLKVPVPAGANVGGYSANLLVDGIPTDITPAPTPGSRTTPGPIIIPTPVVNPIPIATPTPVVNPNPTPNPVTTSPGNNGSTTLPNPFTSKASPAPARKPGPKLTPKPSPKPAPKPSRKPSPAKKPFLFKTPSPVKKPFLFKTPSPSPKPAAATGQFKKFWQGRKMLQASSSFSSKVISRPFPGGPGPVTGNPITSASFTVSDPRPPTADLTVTAPSWVKPTAAVTVSVKAVSYLGSDVSKAPIQVVWRTSKTEGLLELTTDASGSASGVVPLNTLPAVNASSAGDLLSLEASWIGPTRERIVRNADVKLQNSVRRIELSRTLETEVPGVPFGISVTVVSNEDDQVIAGVPVAVTLTPNTTAGVECSTTANCNAVSGNAAASAAASASCQLSLPCMGVFVLKACTSDSSEQACTEFQIGRNKTTWISNPLSTFDEPLLMAPGKTVKLGDTAELRFQNPYAGASALLLWSNSESAVQSRVVASVPVGSVPLPLVLGKECTGGCGVAVILNVPRSQTGAQAGLPVSKLFDPTAPHSHVLTATVQVEEDRAVDVSVSVASPTTTSVAGVNVPVVAPGANAAVNVAVTKKGQAVNGAEVTVIAVDKAVLDLVPYPLRKPLEELAFNLASILSVADDPDSSRVARDAIKNVFDAAVRRLSADPWLQPDLTILPSTFRRFFSPNMDIASVDLTDEQYFDKFASYLTKSVDSFFPFPMFAMRNEFISARPGVYGSVPVPASAPVPGARLPSLAKTVNDGAAASTSGGSSSNGARVSSDFLSTPLFTVVRTGADGKATATFTAPVNLGTFVIRAYAVTQNLEGVGSAETSMVVRRKISLTASLPRIVRAGDDFRAGVLVTAPGLSNEPPFIITVKLTLGSGTVQLTGPDTVQVSLSGLTKQQEARFSFKASALGDVTLRFSADDGQGGSDALQTTLPVVPQQSAVFVATSFALRPPGGDKQAWQEGLALPAAVPGSGTLDLIAGVGYLPSIVASTNAVSDQRRKYLSGEPLDAQTALTLAAVPPLLSLYSQQVTPFQAGNASDAYKALSTLTNSQYGLLPYPPSRWNWFPTRADIVLNSQAAWLLTQFKQGAAGTSLESVLQQNVPTWTTAATRQIIADATLSRTAQKPEPYSDFYSIAWLRSAVGASWEVPDCNGNTAFDLCSSNADVRSDLALTRQISEAPKAGLVVRLLTALTLKATGDAKYNAFITATADALISNLRITGRTAYVSDVPGGRTAAPLETQALGLRLLVALSRPAEASVVQKLAVYLAAPSPDGVPLLKSILPPITQSPWIVSIVSSTLSVYDKSAGSTNPNLQVQAKVSDTTVLQATFDSRTVSNPPVKTSTSWDALGGNGSPGPLTFNVQGTGEASISAGLAFVPAQPLTFPTYRGIWVSSSVQLTDPVTGQPTGPALSKVPLASLVTVTVQVVTPDDLGPVTIEALSAGGLEPLDPATTAGAGAGAGCVYGDYVGDFSSVFYRWWFPICPAQEVRPSSVTWKYQGMFAGTHTLVYKAVAATEGTFLLPPIKASADNQPEVMGMTASGAFTVCSGDNCTAAPAESVSLPKSCPKDCSGNGACNTGSGQCVCRSGLTGPACEQSTTP